jgi:hypothetical protein
MESRQDRIEVIDAQMNADESAWVPNPIRNSSLTFATLEADVASVTWDDIAIVYEKTLAHFDVDVPGVRLRHQYGAFGMVTRRPLAVEPPREGLVARVTFLEHEVETLKRALQETRGLQREQGPQKDPRQAWCEEHIDALRAIPHSYAAIVGDRGLVASGATLSEVRARLDAAGIDRRTVLIVHTDSFAA